jgi:biopolymer transport protein ExbD
MATPAIKRQRKRRRIDTDGDPEFQVAPMVDVLLVLMLFFMAITSTEVLKKDKNLQLADAKNAKPAEKGGPSKKNEIIVNVDWNGITNEPMFSLDGVSYPSAEAMQGVLGKQHGDNPAAYVVIRADKNTQYSNISDVMQACGSVGIATVSFAVLIGGEDNKKQAPAPGGAASN